MELHIVSNGKLTLEQFAEKVKDIEPYVDYFHIREKQLTAKELVEGINSLQQAGIPLSKLIINDRVDVAVVTNVKGVQLAYHSLTVREVRKYFPQMHIGKSVHSLEEAMEAEKEGAHYIVYGHIFPTSSKRHIPPRGVDSLKQLVQHVNIPIIAIGGIKPHHVKEIQDAGACGIAVMSGVLDEHDPITAVKNYKKIGG